MNSLFKYAQGSKPGKKANAYKGDSVSYSAKHKRQSKKDKASKCTRCGSTKNLVWAEKHGTNGQEHLTLCTSCHAKYDDFSDNINKSSSLETFLKMAGLLSDIFKEASTTALTGNPSYGVKESAPMGASSNVGYEIDPEKTDEFFNQHPKFEGYSFGNLKDKKNKNEPMNQNNPVQNLQRSMYANQVTPQIGKGLPGA